MKQLAAAFTALALMAPGALAQQGGGSSDGSQAGGSLEGGASGQAGTQAGGQADTRIEGEADAAIDAQGRGEARVGSQADAEIRGRKEGRLDESRPLDERSLEGQQREAQFGQRRDLDEPRTFDDRDRDLDRAQRGGRVEGGAQGQGDRDRRVQQVAGHWWFQRNSGEWLIYDRQAREWREFEPNLLEQLSMSGSARMQTGGSSGYYGGPTGNYAPRGSSYYGSGYRPGWGQGYGYPDNRYQYYGNRGWGRGFDRGAATGGVIGSEIGGSIGGQGGAAVGGAIGAGIGER